MKIGGKARPPTHNRALAEQRGRLAISVPLSSLGTHHHEASGSAARPTRSTPRYPPRSALTRHSSSGEVRWSSRRASDTAGRGARRRREKPEAEETGTVRGEEARRCTSGSRWEKREGSSERKRDRDRGERKKEKEKKEREPWCTLVV